MVCFLAEAYCLKKENYMTISNDTLDQLIGESKTTDDIFGKGGFIRTLAKRLIERILECEMQQ